MNCSHRRTIAGLETEAVLADRGYDSPANREAIRSRGAEPCILPRRNRVEVVDYDRHLDLSLLCTQLES